MILYHLRKKFQLRMCSAVIIEGGLCSIECRQKQGFPRNNLKLSLYGINNKRSSDTVKNGCIESWSPAKRSSFMFIFPPRGILTRRARQMPERPE